MLTQDKNLRCVATLTSKRKIASLGNLPFVRVLPPGRFKWVIMGNIKCVSWEISFCSKVPVVWFVYCCYFHMSVLYEYEEYIAIKFEYSDG